MSGERRPVAAVVGFPVKHSLSPLIHGLWLKAVGVDGSYTACETPPERFADTVARLRAEGLGGINVTVPHKEAALALADTADDAARAAGASNLLVFVEHGIAAHNTDGIGMLAALAEQAPDWRPLDAVVTVIGAGGAAKGAAAALNAAGVAELRIVNRTVERASALAAACAGRAYDWRQMGEALDGATLVINATTRGLNGADPLELAWPQPPPGGAALDMVYRPLRTAFLEGAQAAGWATADGLAMLIGQARPSFQALFGRPPPASVDVRAACLRAMQAEA